MPIISINRLSFDFCDTLLLGDYMKVQKLVLGDLEENCYILMKDDEAIIIDPGDEAMKILSFVKSLKVRGIFVTHFHFDHIGALKELEDYYNLKVNDFDVLKCFGGQVIETPGHTIDSLSFYFSFLNSMFVGDFVFCKGIGRTDLGGDEIKMKDSVNYLLENFKEDIILYPGHGESTTIKNEKSFLEQFLKF